MARNQEYQKFLDVIDGRVQIEDRGEETIATSQEIGWWKQQQIRRAIHASRFKIATPEQLDLLTNKGIKFPSQAHKKTRLKIKKYNA